MAFQIKDFASIVASCINWMKATTTKVTDYNVGSVARTLVEAPSAEIEQLYLQAFTGLKEAIPVSVYHSFAFDRQPAAPAAGIVRVTVTPSTSPRTIFAGSRFETPSKRDPYLSRVDVLIQPGSSFVDVPVVCQETGGQGNIAALAPFTVSPAPDGFVSASNSAALVSGVHEETDEERRLRFNSFILSLNRGTLTALEYGAKLSALYDPSGNVAERVRYAAIVEPYVADPEEPIAFVRVFVHNGTGGTSQQLVSHCQKVIDGYVEEGGKPVPGWKAAGVVVAVEAAAEQLVPVIGTVFPMPGYSSGALAPVVSAACADYIKALGIGERAIKSELIARAMEIQGVYNFICTSPLADTSAAANVKLLPGTMTIVAG